MAPGGAGRGFAAARHEAGLAGGEGGPQERAIGDAAKLCIEAVGRGSDGAAFGRERHHDPAHGPRQAIRPARVIARRSLKVGRREPVPRPRRPP